MPDEIDVARYLQYERDEADPVEPEVDGPVMFGDERLPVDTGQVDATGRPSDDPPRDGLAFPFSNRLAIPLESGQPVGRGWRARHGYRPTGVTWHWAACPTLRILDLVLGGRRTGGRVPRGGASAHYGIGRTFDEGVSRYVGLEDRSWHAGRGQTLRWDGLPYTVSDDKGARCGVGIELVSMGHDYDGDDGVKVAGTKGDRLEVQPWSDDQVAMAIEVGREIVIRWPHLRPEDHHGHHDLCPGYKLDVVSFPFARVLEGIYGEDVRDVWTPLWSARGRQRVLIALGYDLGRWGADGAWGRVSQAALLAFQRDRELPVNGHWTTSVHRAVDRALADAGLDLAQVAAASPPVVDSPTDGT